MNPSPGWITEWPLLSDVKCLRKRIVDPSGSKDSVFFNTNWYLFTFQRSDLPDQASIAGKVINFTPFVQEVRRCTNCQRFGHLEAQCRDGERARVCRNCAARDHKTKDHKSDRQM